MTEPDIKWTAIAPGRLSLPTTKFEIIYEANSGFFTLYWDANKICSFMSLQEVQEKAKRRMAELIIMGIEV